MRGFLNNQQINFEPPSDFVGESSSSGGRRWLKWVGIGCAGISLVLALVMVFGGFKMVSCCSELIETGKLTYEVESFSQQFARTIQSGDFDVAYGMTSAEHFQTHTSAADFAAMYAPHQELISRSMPVVSNIKVMAEGEKPDRRWEVTMRLIPPEGAAVLTMMLGVDGQAAAEEDQPGSFQVVEVQLDQRRRDINLEPPAVSVREFQDLLRVGDYEGAFARMAPVFMGDLAENERDAGFRAFIKENQDVLTGSAEGEVVRVEYLSSNEALVTMRVLLEEQSTAVIKYTAARLSSHGGWQISAISPEIRTGEAVDGAGQQEVAPEEIAPEAEQVESDSRSSEAVE